MTERLEHELIAHAATLRRLAADLVGGSDADDLVQETALQALRAPRRAGHSHAGFFATILRHLASKHRRSDSRRQERELRAAKPEALPPHDVALAHHETLRRLTEALVALPEPYRGALLSRYYEGSTPAAIAAQRGEPLATVKSRLQRGLAMLRERLDRDADRSDWRGALVSAFGLGDAAKVCTGVAAATTGVILMGTGVKLAIGGAAALAAVAAAFMFAPMTATPVAGVSAPVVNVNEAVAGNAIAPQPGERVDATPRALPTSIAGLITDERGVPLAGVSVDSTASDPTRAAAVSDPAGHFTLVRPAKSSLEPVGLMLTKTGFDLWSAPNPIAWGKTDLVIAMLRSLPFEVRVVREEDGLPVERFALFAKHRDGFFDSSSGRHPQGVAVLTKLRRGEAVVQVDPEDASLAATSLLPVTINDDGPRRLEVRLSRSAGRTVRVRHRDGSPVIDSMVQLLDSLGHTVNASTPAHTMDQWGNPKDDALLLLAVPLDGAGEALLQAAAGRSFTVRVLGAHPAAIVQDVSLKDPAPLVVIVDAGGRLTGTVHPLSTVQELRHLLSLPESGPQFRSHSAHTYRQQFGFRLRRGEGGEREVFPFDDYVIPASDGTLVIDGVPPGNWTVEVWLPHVSRGAGLDVLDIGHVSLRADETTLLDIDLANTTPGDLVCSVLRNDKPFAGQQLTLVFSHEPGAHDRACQGYNGVGTDADGRFTWHDRQGTFWLMQFRGKQRGFVNSFRSLEEVVLHAGESTDAIFHFSIGAVHCRLRDAAGSWVAAVPLQMLDATGHVRHDLPATDREGRTEEEVNAETFQVTVLPRSILDPDVQQEIVKQHPRSTDPLSAFRIRLGEVTVKQGATTDVEFRLPPDWDR